MKNSKLKSLVKSAKKTAKKDIEISLIHKLQEVTVLLGKPSKKLEKAIKKGAKQLARQIGKELQVDKEAVIAAFNETEAAKAPKVAQIELVAPVPLPPAPVTKPAPKKVAPAVKQAKKADPAV